MKYWNGFLPAAILSTLLTVNSCCMAAPKSVVRIAAAANLKNILDDAFVPAYEKATGAQVVLTYGSTQLLARQLEAGKPEDLFLSADTATVKKLAKEGVVDSPTCRVYAIGQLVLWTRKDALLHPNSIYDLKNLSYANIAIANPKLAPYGAAAAESLKNAGMSAETAGRLVQAGNVAEALQFAKTGNADAAFTALSLVISDHKDPFIIVPARLHHPIAQSLGLVHGGNGPAASGFADFLLGKSASETWLKYGYLLPAAAH